MNDSPDPLLYHFTHVRNLDGISAHGLRADGLLPDTAVECAEAGIKERRRVLPVPISPHGTVADYVPFYFAPRSPMLYRIHHGGVTGYSDGQRNLVYLVTQASRIVQQRLAWVATDRNAALADARYTADFQGLTSHVDWEIMAAVQWRNTPTDGQRKQRRMAEFLVHGQVPWSAIPWIVTYADDVAVGLGTPDPADMPTRTKAPGASPERNRFLAALARYIASAWESGVTESPRASVLEAQKVAYLLQAAGLDLKLAFVKHRYGPFSAELNRALATMEGHCLIGYGDGTGGARADLRLMPGVAEQAEESVHEDKEFQRAWAQVRQAILGYEYPEGLELLSSVHLLARTTSHTREPDRLAEALAEWSPRKRHLFTSVDARSAWQRLDQAELIASTG